MATGDLAGFGAQISGPLLDCQPGRAGAQALLRPAQTRL